LQSDVSANADAAARQLATGNVDPVAATALRSSSAVSARRLRPPRPATIGSADVQAAWDPGRHDRSDRIPRGIAAPGAHGRRTRQQGIRIQVIGSADANYEASFVLEVASEGNRSLHHGTVALEPGQPVTLSTVTVGVPAGRPWRASLKVEPRGRQAYEQVESSS
jgi:hypothetical protein